MFGFLFGTACLVGLFWVLKRGHRRHCRGERRTGFALRWLFERLDTTPGQEKVIRSAAEELFEKVRGLKDTVRGTRGDVARAFRADDFNAEILGDVFSRHDGALDELRRAFVGALAKVHEVLDPAQRARLADVLESLHRRGWGGPYRSSGY